MAPKKAAAATGAKKSAAKEPSHPAYLDMIKEAVIALKERNGSSRQEIKKYLLANYKLSAVPEAQFKTQVNRALSKGVSSGALTQPKGASGPVKLAKPESKPPAKPAAAKKIKSEKSETKPATKKAAPTKKAAAPAKKPATKKAAAAAAAAAPAKKAAAKPKAKANTGKPRKTAAAAPAVVKKDSVELATTKSGRITKSSNPQPKKAAPKKAAAKKATPAKKAATPKKA